ncbi:MAG: hypothetical protein RIS92_3035 [Verrucomicrobiota bacterium]
MLHVRRAGVDEFAFDTDGPDALLEFDPEVCGVGWIFLLFAEFGSVVVEKVH